MCVCMKAYMYYAIHVEDRDNLKESVVSFYHVGPKDSTEVIKLRGRQLYWLSQLADPQVSSLMIHIRETHNSMVLNTCNNWTQEVNAGRVYKLHSKTLSLGLGI